MNITLPQAIMLLALNDETGKTEAGYYQPALAGAAIADLLMLETIELSTDEPARVTPLRHQFDLGAFLQMCDAAIGEESKLQPLGFWINRLSGEANFVTTLADELVHLGALSKEKTRIFGLFERTVWPEASPLLESQLKSEIETAMFAETGPVDERVGMVIALCDAADILQHNFDADLLAKYADRIEAISAGKLLSKDTSEKVLKCVNHAIMAATEMAEITAASIIN
ncbi:MAG: GPP34 family phosphoprotein [Pseudomonadota bacterium]